MRLKYVMEVLVLFLDGLTAFAIVTAIARPRSDRTGIAGVLFALVYAAANFYLRVWIEVPIHQMILQLGLVSVCTVILCKDKPSILALAGIVAVFTLFVVHYTVRFFVAGAFNRFLIERYNALLLFTNYKTVVILYGGYMVLDVLLILFRKAVFGRIREIEPRARWFTALFMLIICIAANIFLKEMMNLISVYQMALMVMWSYIFMFFAVIMMIVGFLNVRLRKEAALTNALLTRTNETVGEGYRAVAEKNNELSRSRHDFRNHLKAMRSMNEAQAHAYIDDLLKQDPPSRYASSSGDPFVDAVLGSKLQVIEKKDIDYQQNITLPKPIHASPADICAIIANQLDNAVEACEKIADPAKRWIRFSIDQKGGVTAIVCCNSIAPGSVALDGSTSKENSGHDHGYGVQNIRLSAERNNGRLIQEVREDEFISRVMLQEVEP